MEEAAVMEERMGLAVVQACRALRQRHREEEGAHGPALAALFTALSRPPVMTSPFMLASFASSDCNSFH